MLLKKITHITQGLYEVAANKGLVGKDPYTARELSDRMLMSMKTNKILFRIHRKFIDFILKLNIVDLFSRKVFVPSTAGLLLQSIARLNYSGLKIGEDDIIHLVLKLKSLRSKGFKGSSWGVPFTWYTDVVIPPNIPVITTTSFVANGLLDIYFLFGLEEALNLYLGVPEFIRSELNRIKINDDICFSYSPIDKLMIHNANLMAVEHLLTGYMFTDYSEYLDLALRALKFTLKEIDERGNLCYFSRYSKRHRYSCKQDYHAGFEVNSLINIFLLLRQVKNIDRKFTISLRNYIRRRYEFLTNELIDKETMMIYRVTNNIKKKDIQDSRSYSAVILALVKFNLMDPTIENPDIDKLIVQFNNLLLSNKKYYHYRYYLLKYGNIRDMVYYPRMSVAWPLRMFAEYLLYKNNKMASFYRTRYQFNRL